jgi:putative heme iron utilization protein
VTYLGEAAKIDDPALSARYVRIHPYSAGYAQFADFSFWRLSPLSAHAVAGFGRIETLEKAEFLINDPSGWSELEVSAREHMNDDHRDAVRNYAVNLLGAPDGEWSIAALDPDGADLENDGKMRRLAFEEPVFDAVSLRLALVHLAEQARKKP